MLKPIDNGFYQISAANAKKLFGSLPRLGYEKLVLHEGKHYWLARTKVQDKQVWSLRETKWRLVNERAVLGGFNGEQRN